MRRLIASLVLTSVVALAVVLVGGCADAKMASESRSSKKDVAAKQDRAAPKGEAPGGEALEAAALKRAEGQQKPDNAEKPQRKIIYTGNVSLVVEDFDKAETLLVAYVKEHDGYVSRSEVQGEPGQPRHGSWTVRIPVAKGDDFRKDVLTLGELRNSTLDSRDVTDEYYDTKAVIKNLEAREEALRALYKEKIANSRLQELLEVDRELTSVRTQINVRKGQIQRWDKETEFTTYTLTMYDRRGYVPPASPDFSSSIGRTWSNSVAALRSFGKAIVLFVVAITPWLPVIALVMVPLVLLLRKAMKAQPGPTPGEAPERGRRREPRREAEAVPPVPVVAVEMVDENANAQERVTRERREGPEGD